MDLQHRQSIPEHALVSPQPIGGIPTTIAHDWSVDPLQRLAPSLLSH